MRGASPSTLTISHRSLTLGTDLNGRGLGSDHLRARELAKLFIERHGARVVVDQIVEFINSRLDNPIKYLNGALEFSVSTLDTPDNPLPPRPYGLKGGAARERLVEALRVRSPRPPRDLDLIRRGSFKVAGDDLVAKQYMPRDYAHGARVEIISDTDRYLRSRDLTINEVAIFDNSASCSILAALDSIGLIIRPSYYRGGSIHRQPSLDGRVLLKMARLAAEAARFGEPVMIVGIPDQVSFSDADLAIHLNKAFQRDEAVAAGFVSVLIQLGAIAASDQPLADLISDLSYLNYGEKGLLSDLPDRYR